MTLPSILQRYLLLKDINYDIYTRPTDVDILDYAESQNINPDFVVHANVLKDEDGMLMSIYAINRKMDLDAVNKKLGRHFSLLNTDGVFAPVSMAYRLEALVDEMLILADNLYLVMDHENIIKVTSKDFHILQGETAWYENSVFSPIDKIEQDKILDINHNNDQKRELIKKKLQRTDQLPAMPKIAQEVMQLSANPYASATDLSAIVEQDPSLSAQLIRYANSPFYAYRGEIESIQDAISRVLGFDMVMDMALGVSVGKTFKNPMEGPLGLNAFWRHATYCAFIVQELGKAVKGIHTPRPGMAYLAGLLHNIGFLLLGHLMPEDFKVLNKAVAQHPEDSVMDLEKNMMGVTHTEIGAWLLEAWDMPEELIVTVKEHHNQEYKDRHSVYPNLVLLANRLFSALEMGEEKTNELPTDILMELGLEPEQVQDIFETVLEHRNGLDYMALQMAA